MKSGVLEIGFHAKKICRHHRFTFCLSQTKQTKPYTIYAISRERSLRKEIVMKTRDQQRSATNPLIQIQKIKSARVADGLKQTRYTYTKKYMSFLP